MREFREVCFIVLDKPAERFRGSAVPLQPCPRGNFVPPVLLASRRGGAAGTELHPLQFIPLRFEWEQF